MYIWSSCLLNDHTMIFLTSVRECLLPPTSVRQHQNKFLDVASCHGLNSVLVYLLATVTNTWENQFKVIKWYFGSLLQRFLSKPIHCLSDNHFLSLRKQERQDTSNPTFRHLFLPPKFTSWSFQDIPQEKQTNTQCVKLWRIWQSSNNNNSPPSGSSRCPHIHCVQKGFCSVMKSPQTTKLRSGHLDECILVWLSLTKEETVKRGCRYVHGVMHYMKMRAKLRTHSQATQ